MAHFEFTIKARSIIKKSVIKRVIKPKDNVPKNTGDIIVKGIVNHVDGMCIVIVDDVEYPVTESSSSLVGKLSYFAHIGNVANHKAIRIQDGCIAVSKYPHPFKYKWGSDEVVHGYITTNNYFHVTASFNKKFSTRKPRRSV